MKCVVHDCPEKANTGWMFCIGHLSKGPDAFDIMAEEGKPPIATPRISPKCAVSHCFNEPISRGSVLCPSCFSQCEKEGYHNLDEFIAAMDERGSIPAVPAITPKQNEGKRRFSLVRREFTRAIAEVMTWGLQKYPAENYLSLDSTTIYDSMMRHLDDHLSGKKIDEESGKPHLWHFASNAMMWFMLEYRKDEGK